MFVSGRTRRASAPRRFLDHLPPVEQVLPRALHVHPGLGDLPGSPTRTRRGHALSCRPRAGSGGDVRRALGGCLGRGRAPHTAPARPANCWATARSSVVDVNGVLRPGRRGRGCARRFSSATSGRGRPRRPRGRLGAGEARGPCSAATCAVSWGTLSRGWGRSRTDNGRVRGYTLARVASWTFSGLRELARHGEVASPGEGNPPEPEAVRYLGEPCSTTSGLIGRRAPDLVPSRRTFTRCAGA